MQPHWRTPHPALRDIGELADCRQWAPPLPSVSTLRDIGQCAEHETSEDRPCRALYFFIQITQGLVALAGLRTLGFEKGRPAGAYSAARQLAKELDYRGIILQPALHGIKGPRCGKGPCCGSPPAGLRDCSPGLTPTAVQAPIGATPTKPRVRSPARVTKPWVNHRK